jgi:hypothetical protein
MRPIFNPKARVNVDWPSRNGCAVVEGCIKSGFAPLPFARALAEGSVATGEGRALGVVTLPESPAPGPRTATLDEDAGNAEAGDDEADEIPSGCA